MNWLKKMIRDWLNVEEKQRRKTRKCDGCNGTGDSKNSLFSSYQTSYSSECYWCKGSGETIIA